MLMQIVLEDDDELFEDGPAIIITTLCLGTTLAENARIERRRLHRFYLTRPDLLPNPRSGTSWQRLYDSQNSRAFITTMGFDVDTFHYILRSGFAYIWDNTPIPRNDVSTGGQPRLGARSLDAAGALGLVLHYMCSAMRDTALQEIFALIPSSTSRYLDFAQDILLDVLRIMPEGIVEWWEDVEEMEEDSITVSDRHPLLEGAIGTTDGLGVHTGSLSNPELENATYNGWKSDHTINSVFVFSPRGKFILLAEIITLLTLGTRDHHVCHHQHPRKLA